MERIDFSLIMSHIITETKSTWCKEYLFETLFSDFLLKKPLESAQISRSIRGKQALSKDFCDYFRLHPDNLLEKISDPIMPAFSDPHKVAQDLLNLLATDPEITTQKYSELASLYDPLNTSSIPSFLASLLVFTMTRPFFPRDNQGVSTYVANQLSPLVSDYIIGNNIPAPCAHAVGRKSELSDIHDYLETSGYLFLGGDAGIGKSETAKMYAQQYKNQYTNIIFLAYPGDLQQTIINMQFQYDQETDAPEALFTRHIRFLASLKSDSLIIIDNMDVTSDQDALLPQVLALHCKVLITTRCDYKDYLYMRLFPMSNPDLLQLIDHFFRVIPSNRNALLSLVHQLGGHTLAVELIARLLALGHATIGELYDALYCTPALAAAKSGIHLIKDTHNHRATYYSHIRTLFAIASLSDTQCHILRHMVLMPQKGIHVRLFEELCDIDTPQAIDDLVDMGLIYRTQRSMISICPLLRDFCAEDLEPSITACNTLIKTLSTYNRAGSQNIMPYTIYLQILENIAHYIDFCEGFTLFDFIDYYFANHDDKRLVPVLCHIISNYTFRTCCQTKSHQI